MPRRKDCWCCTCPDKSFTATQTVMRLDPACRNHGAHGKRECRTHKNPGEACKWNDGCQMTVKNVMEGDH